MPVIYQEAVRAHNVVSDKETLRFLFDKRLQLFNSRQDYQWKLFTSLVVTLGALDVFIITQKIAMLAAPIIMTLWTMLVAILATTYLFYSTRLRHQNVYDRLAMIELHQLLCELVNTPLERLREAPIFIDTTLALRAGKSHTILFEYFVELFIVLLASLVSMYFPYILGK